jgi:hypothetical protein
VEDSRLPADGAGVPGRWQSTRVGTVLFPRRIISRRMDQIVELTQVRTELPYGPEVFPVSGKPGITGFPGFAVVTGTDMRVHGRCREFAYIVSQTNIQALQQLAESGLACPRGKLIAHRLQRTVGIHSLAGNVCAGCDNGYYQYGNTAYDKNFHSDGDL